MHHDDHDDGLVHPHNWATEKPAPVMGRARIAAAMNAHPAERDYDDGLVHGHGWARQGPPAHG
jgi:hypothetical protein